MLEILINAIKIVFVLGFLITIHEGGHFLIAKLCKVKVNDFSIGFGPIIWKKQGKETKYTLRLIPLGGFVNLEGEEERSEKEGSFSKAPIAKRIAIVVAGGGVNIIFGVILYFVLVSFNGNFVTTTIENTISGYGCEIAGIQSGDEIVKINNKTVHLKYDIDDIMEKSTGEALSIDIKRNNEIINYKVNPTEEKTKNIGIYFGNSSESLSTEIKYVYPDSPASDIIKKGDIVKEINGIDVESNPYKVVELINSSDEKINITVTRNGEEVNAEIEPIISKAYYLGVYMKQSDKSFGNNIYYGFWDTVRFSTSIIDNLKMLFKGKVSVDQMMGPIGISEMVAETNGVYEFIYLLALISLSLGVTNLLPFPPLDGGKIVLLIIEAIRRKPLRENFEIGLQTAGFLVLITFSIYISYNDIVRIFIK